MHPSHWPPGLPRHLTLPQTSLHANLEVSARRYPDKPAVRFYGSSLTYRDLLAQIEAIAAHLQQVCGVARGDRVLLYMQNSPQWVAAFYGILRADAVVVPVNPMNLGEELRHFVADSGACVAFAPQDLASNLLPLLDEGRASSSGLQHLIVATYSDALNEAGAPDAPEFVTAARRRHDNPGAVAWVDMLAAARAPRPALAGPDDLAVMPYTSGTTGKPKGCMHTHRSAMSTLVGGAQWFARNQDAVYLSVLPFFHVTGMSGSMNGPIWLGATIVILPRWDRDAAARAIERERITVWQLISTMMIDFLSNPRLREHDLSSLQVLRGGGAAMPAALVARLQELTGLDYVEGYGMSETLAATHINPMHRPKPQCLGIPVFDVDSRLVDPLTLEEVAAGETGEIVVSAPQVMRGYWNDPQADATTFFERDGKRFLRTGDLARIDDDGYYFMVDRLKRMINVSGYKVWPAEVEAMMYHHPAIQEACVIGAHDERRGETVKALVVLRADHAGRVTEQELIDWSREQMAAYKAPRIIEFVESLPRSASGKVLWRELQAQEKETLMIEPIPHIPSVREQVSPEEWQLRCELAAAYRLVAMFGWDDLVFTHLSARVPGPDGDHGHAFLINPYGLFFEEITASSLVKVDADARPLMDSPFPVNPAGFVIHSAVHGARHDAVCVMHTHTVAGVAVSAQADGLLPVSQQACFPLASIGYHGYEGLALRDAEKARLVEDLGSANHMILRNHGLLSCGRAVSEAFTAMYRLQRACEMQIAAQSGGSQLTRVPQEIIDGITAQSKIVSKGLGSRLVWPGLLRRLDRHNPGWAV